MGVLASSRALDAQSGPRRLDPSRDLLQVANLIEEAFADELDREGREVLDELRRLSRLGVILWIARHISLDVMDMLSGFVWEEDGQIVGNASLSVATRFPPTWRISNVAVKREYRGRGIARRLMEVAIDYVRQMGARTITLQVRDDNQPALRLYRGLGFNVITAETELMLTGKPEPVVPPQFVQPRPVDPDEWPDLYALALAAVPKSDQRLAPLHRLDFQLDWMQRLSETILALTTGRRTYRLVADGHAELAGYLVITTSPRHKGCHRMTLFVHPNYVGRVERDLISAGLRQLAAHETNCVQVKLNPEKTHLVEAFQAFGFQRRRTLLTMELRVSS